MADTLKLLIECRLGGQSSVAFFLPYDVRKPNPVASPSIISDSDFVRLHKRSLHLLQSFIAHNFPVSIGSTKELRRPFAVVLPNSLEFVLAFFAVANSGFPVAPLNPAYTLDEFTYYLQDLNACAVIVANSELTLLNESGKRQLVVDAAKKLDLFVLSIGWNRIDDVDLIIEHSPVSFRGFPSWHEGASISNTIAEQLQPQGETIALILHTSGTTSRPKSVPLTHRNIMTSVRNICSTYYLGHTDTSLLVMPLFHVHGLIGCLFSTLFSMGQVVLPLRFSANSFLSLLQQRSCTWYTASPAIHKILLSRPEYLRTDDGFGRLRFIRSCSSALPSETLKELEHIFTVPVLEAYAMTEASHQVTSNPLPPTSRRVGSVGLATYVAAAVFDIENPMQRKLCAVDLTGEVCISGQNVTRGYLNNAKANEESFFDFGGKRWFRTGDQGYLDADGFLFLSGRLKEIINRGGEKINPFELDSVLLQHPAVAEAVSFGVPHSKYGEDVNAAVVLKHNCEKEFVGRKGRLEAELKELCLKSLASFKCPSKIYVTDKLPQTATGKVQRRNVAQHFLKDQEGDKSRQTKAKL